MKIDNNTIKKIEILKNSDLLGTFLNKNNKENLKKDGVIIEHIEDSKNDKTEVNIDLTETNKILSNMVKKMNEPICVTLILE